MARYGEQPQPQGRIALGETSSEINIPASLFLREQPRPDGYQPLMNAAWVWHQIIANTIIANNKLHPDTFRHLWNIARRLDAAHRQFEVVRLASAYASRHGAQAVRAAGGSNTLVGLFIRTLAMVAARSRSTSFTSAGARWRLEDDVAGDRRRLLASVHHVVRLQIGGHRPQANRPQAS